MAEIDHAKPGLSWRTPQQRWQVDLDWSHKAFLREIAPILTGLWGGEFFHVENQDDAVKVALDREAGIDFYHRLPRGGMRGLASRVQVPGILGKSYQTFTVRMTRDSGARTEYEKRTEAIRDGLVYPQLTAQGYVTDKTDVGKLIDFAVCRTERLMHKIDSRIMFNKRTSNAAFAAIPWGEWCEIVHTAKRSDLPWWCDPDPGPCTYCGHTHYYPDERSSRYICAKCGLFYRQPLDQQT